MTLVRGGGVVVKLIVSIIVFILEVLMKIKLLIALAIFSTAVLQAEPMRQYDGCEHPGQACVCGVPWWNGRCVTGYAYGPASLYCRCGEYA